MTRILTTLAALLVAASPAAAQKRPDRVVLVEGAPLEGKVSKDTWKNVVIRTTAGSTRTLSAKDVVRVEYGDAPPAFRGAMAAIRQEKWAEALSSLGSAEEYVQSAARDKTVVKPGSWFQGYVTYWRGYCLLKVAQTSNAIRQFEKLRKEDPDSRFLVETYEQTLEAYRIKRDEKGMASFAAQIAKAPAELQAGLRANVDVQRAEILYDKKNYREAKTLFEKHARSPDKALATQATMGVIRCYSGLKDATALERYVKGVLAGAQDPALSLIASNALADAAMEKKQFTEARDHYINSVVKYNPGRGSGVTREHERAIYQLAKVYEILAVEAKEPTAQTALKVMAARTYRELSVEYASGRWYEEALAKAKSLEPKSKK